MKAAVLGYQQAEHLVNLSRGKCHVQGGLSGCGSDASVREKGWSELPGEVRRRSVGRGLWLFTHDARDELGAGDRAIEFS